MISIVAFFGMFIAFFGVMGAMRGWAKVLLVTSAVGLCVFINAIRE